MCINRVKYFKVIHPRGATPTSIRTKYITIGYCCGSNEMSRARNSIKPKGVWVSLVLAQVSKSALFIAIISQRTYIYAH